MTSQLSWSEAIAQITDDALRKTTAVPPVAEIPKGTAVLPLSWQPPMPAPVTRCGECEYAEHDWQTCELDPASRLTYNAAVSSVIYLQNKDGITKSCPMWQQQNKEVK
jgi:hypothetical protein